MTAAIGLIIMTAAILISVFTIKWTILDFRKQKKFTESLEYNKYWHNITSSKKAVKKMQFFRQSNTGPDPDTFDKDILLVDYSKNCQFIIKAALKRVVK